MASKLSSLLNKNNSKSKPSSTPLATSSATVSGGDTEVYIRADGKKVRRIRKTVARTPSSDTMATTESEIYIRPDGKKVRRVRKANSVMSLPTSTADTTTTEVYINQDGKKVRRVLKKKKSVNNGDSSSDTASVTSTRSNIQQQQPLGGFLKKSTTDNPNVQVYINADGKKVRRILKPKGSSSVASASVGGEIYVRPDGKKVRRVVKRNVSSNSLPVTSSSSPSPEVYINKDGKKVRRVKKSASSASLPRVVRSASSDAEGEIYIRPDGKKVRRVRKPKPTLGGFLDTTTTTKPITGSATVAGDGKLDGEIIVRPDGKKVIRRIKNKDTKEGEVYRRADGKLVRRVKRSASAAAMTPLKPKGPKLSDSEEATATQYRNMKNMGLPDDAVRHKMTVNEVDKKIQASVLGEDYKEEPPTTRVEPPRKGPKLSESEEATATQYRKMKNMGLPDDAVRHKMTVNEVDKKIQASVLGEDYKEEPPSTPAEPPRKGPKLSESEEATATQYRKMKSMGLPDDAVRHKMTVNEVDKKIQASVLGEDYKEEPPPPATASTAEPPKEDDNALTPEEQNIADLYRKMMQMGLPEGAVRHKMVVSEIHPKVIAAVFGDSIETSPKRPAQTFVKPPVDQKLPEVDLNDGQNANLSPEDQERAKHFQKMLRMGLPPDAVRHKMVVAEVSQAIIDAVLGDQPPAPAVEPDEADTRPLTAEEEAVADQYRKMKRLGMPDDAIRHKMIISEVDPRIITAVFDGKDEPKEEEPSAEDSKPAATPEPVEAEKKVSESSTTQSNAPNAVAFVVVVGDESADRSAKQALASGGSGGIDLDPDEKFAVKVKEKSTPEAEGEHTTKFFTLDELAKLSGQSKDDLQAIVAEKKKRSKSPPRFSLLPVEEQKFEVSVPHKQTPASSPSGPSLPAGTDPNKVKEVGDGQEVVDSELAQAARAVTALGDGDMSALLEKLKAGDMKDLLAKLHEAEKRQKKLEKQLAQSGIAIAEDIEYSEAKDKVEEIAKRMNEIGGSDVTVADKEEQNKLREEYFKLEQEMERYNTALMLTEEYQAEQDRLERKWEDDNEPDNLKALKKLRRHMPVNIRHLSEADLTTKPSPNGKYLPKMIAKKFKRTNVLQCLRLNPDDIECMHPATLENMRVTGLTLTERRALYAHLRPIGPKWKKNKAEKMTERKWTWYQMMKSNFKEAVAPYQRHIDQYGPPENHVNCPLIGKQCPIKADKVMDYDGDYGWTSDDEYEVSEVRKADVEDSGAKAMAEARELAKEKKANERADILKKHYKGKLLQVSKANGSCESMDESMDNMENNIMRWIEVIADRGPDEKKELASFTDSLNEFKLKLLDYAQRSGMQMSGKKKAGGDSVDIRSIVEVSLAEEVFECSKVFFKFIGDRMKELKAHDTRITKTIEMLEGILSELHERNENVIKNLNLKRLDRSRKLRTIADLRKEVEEKRKPEEEEAEAPAAAGPPAGGPGRGGLMDAISGRGRGRGGGRGGLMDAIAGRGRGGRGGDAGGGRGGLLDAIAGRGKGRGGGGGRGGLMDAIAARGRGRGPPGGGRGGLMAAIAARGGGGD